jgi:chromate reductase
MVREWSSREVELTKSGYMMLKWFLAVGVFVSAFLSAEINVLAFSGSTRTDSLNKKLVVEAAKLARQQGANVTVINLKEFPLPLFDEDLEAKEGMPAKAKQLRQLMIQSEVILIASPEYNSSVSAVLKNTLDWASRTEAGDPSRNAFKGKRFLIMSVSPGSTGGARGLAHLRSIIEDIGGKVIPQQVAIPNGFEAFDQQGNLKNPQAQTELQQAVQKALNG